MKNEVNRTLVVKKKITLFFIILLSFLTIMPRGEMNL